MPGLRHAKHLVDGDPASGWATAVEPRVIVNRFEQRMFGPGLRRADLKQALGRAFAGTIPNNYGLVREAIDRGVPLEEVKPRNNIAAELKKLLEPHGSTPRQRHAARCASAERPRPDRGRVVKRIDEESEVGMLGRFTARRVAAPALVPADGAGAGAARLSRRSRSRSRCPIRPSSPAGC